MDGFTYSSGSPGMTKTTAFSRGRLADRRPRPTGTLPAVEGEPGNWILVDSEGETVAGPYATHSAAWHDRQRVAASAEPEPADAPPPSSRPQPGVHRTSGRWPA